MYCTRIKFAARLFTYVFWPWMRLASYVAVIQAEKDPVPRKYNRPFLGYLFDPALLMSDKIVVVAQKMSTDENRSPS